MSERARAKARETRACACCGVEVEHVRLEVVVGTETRFAWIPSKRHACVNGVDCAFDVTDGIPDVLQHGGVDGACPLCGPVEIVVDAGVEEVKEVSVSKKETKRGPVFDWWFWPHFAVYLWLGATLQGGDGLAWWQHVLVWAGVTVTWELFERFGEKTWPAKWNFVHEHHLNAWLMDPIANGLGYLTGVLGTIYLAPGG